MTIKDFDALSGMDGAPKAFKLGGKTWHIKPEIPVVPFLRAVSGKVGDEIPIEKLLECVIVPKEVDELIALVNDPRTAPLTRKNLPLFTEWLVEATSDRPTIPPSSLEGGSEHIEPSSRAGSASRATRRARSTTSARTSR